MSTHRNDLASTSDLTLDRAGAVSGTAQGALGLMAAMDAELAAILPHLQHTEVVVHGGRRFHCGTWHAQPVVAVLSGIGKVAAATTATLLHAVFGIDRLVFTGVAGGVGAGVRVGDVVLGDGFVQHDMDASPLFPRFELPGMGRAVLPADAALTASLAQALDVLHHNPVWREIQRSGLVRPEGSALHQGLILSGDRFVGDEGLVHALRTHWPEALAVEMEGAAVAQVCADLALPFAVMRTISDRADSQAHVDFGAFLHSVASPMAAAWLDQWLSAQRKTAMA